jgi:hypothetical protein
LKTKENMKKNITIPDSTELYVGPKTIAALYGFRVTTIYNWAKRSNFPAVRLPRNLRMRPSEVHNWLLHTLPRLTTGHKKKSVVT